MGVIADQIQQCTRGTYANLLVELPSGYAVLNERQPDPINGCCMLLPRSVVSSPNDLSHLQRGLFFSDIVLLGDAIMIATGSMRINYLVLCNQAPELHGHCIPRFENEDPELRKLCPFESYDFGSAPRTEPENRHQELKRALQNALKELTQGRA